MLDEQRHLYSGCYYEKYHIVNSLCSHSIYQCRRNTRSRHSEWLVKQPLQIADSSIFLQIIPINKGGNCMSSTKSDISVYFFQQMFQGLQVSSQEDLRDISNGKHMGISRQDQLASFQEALQDRLSCEFTTACDLALSPSRLRTLDFINTAIDHI